MDERAAVGLLRRHDVIGRVLELVRNLQLQKDSLVVVAIGDNRARMHVAEKLGLPREQYAAVIDPSAVVSRHASITEGTVVLQGAIVNAGTVV